MWTSSTAVSRLRLLIWTSLHAFINTYGISGIYTPQTAHENKNYALKILLPRNINQHFLFYWQLCYYWTIGNNFELCTIHNNHIWLEIKLKTLTIIELDNIYEIGTVRYTKNKMRNRVLLWEEEKISKHVYLSAHAIS